MVWTSDCLVPVERAGGEWIAPPLPRFFEGVSCGFPSPAEGYEDEPLDLNGYLVRNPAATFFYRVRGDELCDEHVRDGSILVVDRSVRPAIGRLVVLEQNGGFTVVRLPDGAGRVRCCGVVVAVVLRF